MSITRRFGPIANQPLRIYTNSSSRTAKKKVLPRATPRKEIPDLSSWLAVHGTVMEALVSGARPRKDIRAMIHHQITVITRAGMYRWAAVARYDIRKRQAADGAERGYSA